MKFDVRRLCVFSLSVSLALIFSFVESQIPPFVAVPGIKIGLSNIVAVFLLYTSGAKDTALVQCVRVVLGGLLFGNPVGIIYSLSGAVLSFVVMLAVKKAGVFSPVGVSVLGGVSHNVGQVICAAIIMDTAALAYYLPVLLISGVISGAVIGVLAGLVTLKLGKFTQK